jgi:hypothetical protein
MIDAATLEDADAVRAALDACVDSLLVRLGADKTVSSVCFMPVDLLFPRQRPRSTDWVLAIDL